jgi:hypothetical protein
VLPASHLQWLLRRFSARSPAQSAKFQAKHAPWGEPALVALAISESGQARKPLPVVPKLLIIPNNPIRSPQ